MKFQKNGVDLDFDFDNYETKQVFYPSKDGTKVPMWHDSETAAIGYAIQNIIEQRENNYAKSDSNDMESNSTPIMSGKKCPDCGAHAVIKKDGCSYCTQCGYIGSCG